MKAGTKGIEFDSKREIWLLMELLEEWLKEHTNDSKRNNAKGLLELLGYLLMKDYA